VREEVIPRCRNKEAIQPTMGRIISLLTTGEGDQGEFSLAHVRSLKKCLGRIF